MEDTAAEADADVPSSDAGSEGGGPQTDPNGFPEELAPWLSNTGWTPCQLDLESSGFPGECATVQAPLNWREPEGPKTTVAYRRWPSAQPSGVKLWLIPGGPGFSGYSLLGLANAIRQKEPGVEFYFIDHRGTGDSELVTCPGMDADSPGGPAIVSSELEACFSAVATTYGDDLRHYGTTASALDLAAGIEAFHEPDERVFVFGGSYGTFLVNRWLQLRDTTVKGVIVDSLCGPGLCWISEQDRWYNDTAVEFLALCDANPFCASKTGGDTWATLEAAHTALASGQGCVPGADPAQRRQVLRALGAQMLFNRTLRHGLPALIVRAARCEPGDAEAISHLVGAIFGPGALAEPSEEAPSPALAAAILRSYRLYNPLLASAVANGEMWNPAQDIEEVSQYYEDSLLASGTGVNLAWERQFIGAYPSDPVDPALAVTDVPMLMLHAEIDPATPVNIARPWSKHFTGSNQTYVEVPFASHTVIVKSPTAAGGVENCGMDLMRAFLAAPNSALDLSCTADVLPILYENIPSSYAQTFFGTADAYENEPTVP
jgi:alpha-beta hydrolase superfamily lysophospholipase